jgi:hypothetical protein
MRNCRGGSQVGGKLRGRSEEKTHPPNDASLGGATTGPFAWHRDAYSVQDAYYTIEAYDFITRAHRCAAPEAQKQWKFCATDTPSTE